jgi:hypothetical protein
MPTVEEIADAMYKMVVDAEGKKNIKPGDLTKAMKKQMGADKATCKKAIRALIESGRCVYSYFGGSYVTLPKEEGAAKDID